MVFVPDTKVQKLNDYGCVHTFHLKRNGRWDCAAYNRTVNNCIVAGQGCGTNKFCNVTHDLHRRVELYEYQGTCVRAASTYYMSGCGVLITQMNNQH